MNESERVRKRVVRRALTVLLGMVWVAGPGVAVDFSVDSSEDHVDMSHGDGVCLTTMGTCTVRAAIEEANALAGLDRVLLPAGVYELSLAGVDEDLSATGDLDVLEDLEIRGASESSTFLDAVVEDRVLDIVSVDRAPGVTLTLRQLTVRSGSVEQSGGCLRVAEGGTLLLDHVTIRDCECRRFGCGVFNSGTLTGDEVSWLENHGTSGFARGGALANVGGSASFELSRCLLAGNSASNGGGVYIDTSPNATPLTVERCALVGNEVIQLGGGIHLDFLAHLTLTNTTITANLAGAGGGLFNDGGGVIEIRNSTIHANHAPMGGGIGEVHFDPDLIRISNSILAGNTGSTGPDCHLTLTSEGATLVGDPTDCIVVSGPGDLPGADPQLGPLVPVGRGFAHYPQPSSPVLDVGSDVLCVATDQAERSRPADSDGDGVPHCDIGALEGSDLIFSSGFESGDTSDWFL